MTQSKPIATRFLRRDPQPGVARPSAAGGVMTASTIRPLRYRYYIERPSGEGIACTEWAVEVQLSLAADYGEPNLRAALLCFRPELDETVGHRLDELLDLADDVARAENSGPREQYYLAVDLYASALRELALLLRGVR